MRQRLAHGSVASKSNGRLDQSLPRSFPAPSRRGAIRRPCRHADRQIAVVVLGGVVPTVRQEHRRRGRRGPSRGIVRRRSPALGRNTMKPPRRCSPPSGARPQRKGRATAASIAFPPALSTSTPIPTRSHSGTPPCRALRARLGRRDHGCDGRRNEERHATERRFMRTCLSRPRHRRADERPVEHRPGARRHRAVLEHDLAVDDHRGHRPHTGEADRTSLVGDHRASQTRHRPSCRPEHAASSRPHAGPETTILRTASRGDECFSRT